MKRRISQLAIAVVAVVTLTACIIITSDSQELATAPQAPAETQSEA